MSPLLKRIAGAPIALKSLSKHYGKSIAVDNASLDVSGGEFVTFLGPSGSGKTTTLLMIAGFVTPSNGEILIGDKSVIDVPAYKRNLGMVFQNYSLFPHMTVFENIAFPLEMRRFARTEIRTRVNAVLELVRLPGFGSRRVRQLSGGQQQRIALARALVYEPSVLLLDEPLGALDLKLRQELQLELMRMHKQLGITIVFVTHDQGEALTMSDRIVVMNGGTVQQVGTPEDLYKRPANRFVAEFVGESNLISGTAERMGAQVEIATKDGLRLIGVGRGLAPTRKATAILRPESIVSAAEADGLPNRFCGEVLELQYQGDAVKYSIRVGPETALNVKWLMRASTQVFKLGDRVIIGWAAEDLTVV